MLVGWLVGLRGLAVGLSDILILYHSIPKVNNEVSIFRIKFHVVRLL